MLRQIWSFLTLMTANDHFLLLHNYRLEVIVPFDTSKEYHK